MVDTARQQYDLGLDALASGRPAAAVTALKRALALEERFAPAHHALGIALRDLERLGEAQRSFSRALEIDSSGNQSRIELADTLSELGQLEQAAAYYREAISAGGAGGGLHMRLGAVLWKSGNADGARDEFERAISCGAGTAEAYYNLGSAQLESGQFVEAEKSAREAMRKRPGFAEAEVLCAAALVAQGEDDAGISLLRKIEAVDGNVVEEPCAVDVEKPDMADGNVARIPNAAFMIAMRLMSSRLFEPARRCLEKVVNDPQAQHLLAAVSGENPDHPVEGYVRQLFDASAPTFDRHVAAKLAYGIPREMVEALLEIDRGPWDVLDLGCGTGLVGVEIAAYSRRLVGVDIAPNMIRAAQATGVYSELHCADITAAMNGSFDVVTAADVFIYVGRLDEVVPAVRKALKPGGLFGFSVESLADGQDYKLGVMGRYAHSSAYLSRLARLNSFESIKCKETTIRLEQRKPVAGLLSIWRLKDGAS